ncbi:hypothetical protein [Streptomyces sp. Amel2xE9]|nr:hypothetical protein [Streptomyces sp. Amel2xE9]
MHRCTEPELPALTARLLARHGARSVAVPAPPRRAPPLLDPLQIQREIQ